MEHTGRFDPEILHYIDERIRQGVDDTTIKTELLGTDARFTALNNDSQTAEAYIVYARKTVSGAPG